MQAANNRIAFRYATSLIDLATEKDSVTAVLADMQLVAQVLNDNISLRQMLNSPIVNADKKLNVLKALFQDKVSALTFSLITLMVAKSRESLLQSMATSYVGIYNKQRGIVSATVTSTVALTADQVTIVTGLVKKYAEGQVNQVALTQLIDKNLIGGFVLRIADKQIDESVATRFQTLKTNLIDNSYINKI